MLKPPEFRVWYDGIENYWVQRKYRFLGFLWSYWDTAYSIGKCESGGELNNIEYGVTVCYKTAQEAIENIHARINAWIKLNINVNPRVIYNSDSNKDSHG